MTRDDPRSQAAVAEYSEIQTSAVLLEHAGADEGLRKVLSEARRHLAKAEEMQREAQARHTLAHSLPSAPSSRALRASSVAEPRLPGPLSLTLSPLRPGAIGLAHEAGKASYRVGLVSAALSRVAEHGLSTASPPSAASRHSTPWRRAKARGLPPRLQRRRSSRGPSLSPAPAAPDWCLSQTRSASSSPAALSTLTASRASAASAPPPFDGPGSLSTGRARLRRAELAVRHH